MARRRARLDLGAYVKTPDAAPAPIERVVEEGVLIALSAVRMAVKNRIIVSALGDRSDYSAERFAAAAREEILALAHENDETAERVEAEHEAEHEAGVDAADDADDPRAVDRRRRPQVHRLLADALRAEAERPEDVAALVDRARLDAGEEAGRALIARLTASAFDREPDYVIDRIERLRLLIEVDLASLRRRR